MYLFDIILTGLDSIEIIHFIKKKATQSSVGIITDEGFLHNTDNTTKT